jgi:hypothetical protein
MFRINNISPQWFACFRSILGIYLCIHFIPLIAYSGEVWGAHGLLPDARVNLTYGVWPDVLSHFNDLQIQILIIAMTVLSAVLASGYLRPIIALFLWMGWVALFNRNNFIGNPSLPFIGWLLLVCAVVPSGERRWFEKRTKSDFQFPNMLFVASWIIMAAAYTISGIDKLNAPGWCDGTAISHLIVNPLARNSELREILLQCPTWLLAMMTYSVLLIEIAFLPLALFNSTRKWIWLAMVLAHLGILVIVDFADLTLGMLMIHVFTFDPTWWKWSALRRLLNS